jgi:hypothetical protein
MNEEKELNSIDQNEQIEEPIEETNIEETEQQEESTEPAPKDAKQSWRELSEKAAKADALQKERDQYLELLKQIHENSVRQQQQSQYKEPEEEFDYSSIDDDDLPDGKTVKKLIKSEQKKRERLEQYIKDQQQIQYENQILHEMKSKFGDFDSVVNKENITKFRELRPGLARSLYANPDLREKAIETYYAIKDLGIYEPVSYTQDRDRVKKNASKPKSTQSLGGRESNDPLSYANAFSEGLTEELKRKLYETAKKKAGRV